MTFNEWVKTSGNQASGSNRNLLHNWDFRNPVNQRGQMMYTSGYTIDRWRLRVGSVLAVDFSQGFLTLTNIPGIAGTRIFEQYIEFPDMYVGLQLTVSVETDEGIFTRTSVLPNAGSIGGFPLGNSHFHGSLARQSNGRVEFRIRLDNDSPAIDANVNIYRVKLELGSISTLTNDPPMDFGKELTVCQRHQIIMPGTNGTTRLVGHGIVLNDNMALQRTIHAFIPTPTSLRVNPTVSTQPVPNAVNATSFRAIASTGTVFTVEGIRNAVTMGNGVSLQLEVTGTGSLPRDVYTIATFGVNSLFDANL